MLTIEDYKPVCSPRDLEILQQADTLTRQRAERTALEEVASYLRSRYDIEKAYAAVGDNRNPHLVQICVNVTLYYLVQWLPGRMGATNRVELYESSIEWLKNVQSGKASPALPAYLSVDGMPAPGMPMMSGGFKRQKNDW